MLYAESVGPRSVVADLEGHALSWPIWRATLCRGRSGGPRSVVAVCAGANGRDRSASLHDHLVAAVGRVRNGPWV